MRGSVLRSLAATTALLALGACGAAPTSNPSAASSSSSHSALPTRPSVGACRNLTWSAAAGSSDSTPVVSCTRKHTAVTVAVGSLVDKEHPTLTNVNSSAVQRRLTIACPKAVKAYAGGSHNAFELSLVKAVWFLPTRAQIESGAHWYRCDLVVMAGPNRLAPLTGPMHRLLDPPHALNRWGMCGNAAPSSKTFRWSLCSQRHRWRAVAVVSLPKKSAYLSRSTGANAVKKCGAIAASSAAGQLKYTWSFEWPNKQQWQAGYRYGWCWLPRSN